MIRTIEYDHYPEKFENEKGTRRLELLVIKENLRDGGQRREFFANLPNEQFLRMVGYINSVTRGKKLEYDYSDGQLLMSETPPLEDKAPLMVLTFEAVRNILTNSNLENERALRLAGLTLAGAINLIHPYKNGNGRSGRLLHYLVEFGTERGDKAFNEEMYAIVGKLPVYDTDSRVSLYNTPPPELDHALNAYLLSAKREQYLSANPRDQASARVATFLDMMQGQFNIPILEKVVRTQGSYQHGNRKVVRFEPNELDGTALFEMDYVMLSTIPNRLPIDIPKDANRVMAQKPDSVPQQMTIPLDVIS